MRLIDLTIPVCEELTPVPGHPHTRREPIITSGYDFIANTLLIHSLHSGTHVDAPKHFYPDGLAIDRVDLNRLVGKTFLVDVHDFVRPGSAITVDDLKRGGLPDAEQIKDNRILIYANWCAHRWNNGPLYRGQPYLHTTTAKWLVNAGLAALASDFPIDNGPPYQNHQIMLGAGILLIENLINIEQINQTVFTLLALPLKIKDDNGGPARVVALAD